MQWFLFINHSIYDQSKKKANLDDYCTEVVLLCWLIYLNSVYIDYSNTKYETFTFQFISLL